MKGQQKVEERKDLLSHSQETLVLPPRDMLEKASGDNGARGDKTSQIRESGTMQISACSLWSELSLEWFLVDRYECVTSCNKEKLLEEAGCELGLH